MSNSIYSDDHVAFLQERLNAGRTYSEAARAFYEKTGIPMNRNKIAGLIHRKYLVGTSFGRSRRPNSEVHAERMKRARELCEQKFPVRVIARELGVTRNSVVGMLKKLGLEPIQDPRNIQPLKRARRQRSDAERSRWRTGKRLPPEPQDFELVADIGVSVIDLEANHCRWPVAVDPEYKRQRFCGSPRMMNGHYFASSYCPEHFTRSTKYAFVCEAAE